MFFNRIINPTFIYSNMIARHQPSINYYSYKYGASSSQQYFHMCNYDCTIYI